MTTQVPSEGFLKEGDVVAAPTADNPIGDKVTGLRYKGYLEYWDTKTGVRNQCPHWFKWQVDAMTHEDGSPMYTFTDPHIPLDHGQDLQCPLNPQSPEHYKVADKGFRACKKSHIPNRDAMERHVRSSHKRAWESMATDARERVRLEDRDLQLQILASNQELIKAMMSQNAPAVAVAPVVGETTVECEKCGKSFTKDTADKARSALTAHQISCNKT